MHIQVRTLNIRQLYYSLGAPLLDPNFSSCKRNKSVGIKPHGKRNKEYRRGLSARCPGDWNLMNNNKNNAQVPEGL